MAGAGLAGSQQQTVQARFTQHPPVLDASTFPDIDNSPTIATKATARARRWRRAWVMVEIAKDTVKHIDHGRQVRMTNQGLGWRSAGRAESKIAD